LKNIKAEWQGCLEAGIPGGEKAEKAERPPY